MLGPRPPYALETPVFRFRALASHAGRAALGGDRETALACFMLARLAAGLLPPLALPHSESASRAAATRAWLTALSLPAPARSAAGAVADAVASGDRAVTARAIGGLAESAAAQLDPGSAAELADLAAELDGRGHTGR